MAKNIPEMPPEVVAPDRMHVSDLPGIDEIEHARRGSGKYRNAAVEYIIALRMDEQEHRGEGDQLEQKRTDRDIGIALKPLVEPFHLNRAEQDRDAHHQVEGPVIRQRRDKEYADKKCGIRDDAHHQVDHQELLNSPAQFFAVIPDLRTGADPVRWDSELGKHGEIRNQRCCKSDPAVPLRSEYAGYIRKGDDRKDK